MSDRYRTSVFWNLTWWPVTQQWAAIADLYVWAINCRYIQGQGVFRNCSFIFLYGYEVTLNCLWVRSLVNLFCDRLIKGEHDYSTRWFFLFIPSCAALVIIKMSKGPINLHIRETLFSQHLVEVLLLFTLMFLTCNAPRPKSVIMTPLFWAGWWWLSLCR